MTDELQGLIERIEAASELRRQLDADIAREVGRIPKDAVLDSDGTAWHNRLGYEVPNYTGSLDAAMTLVPENGFCEINWYRGRSDDGKDDATVWALYGEEYCCHANAATPALALCAAALRAKGSSSE